LSPTRDAQAAKRFFMKARHSTADSVPGAHPAEEQVAQPTAPANPTTPTPRVINVEKNAAYPKAEASLKAVGMLPASVELRQVKYLNNLVEQDHRFIKRLVKPGMGFFSVETAGRTLQGYEAMHMIRQGQMQGVSKGDIGGQVTASSEWRPKHNKNGEPLAMAFLCEFLQHNRSAYPHLKTVRSG